MQRYGLVVVAVLLAGLLFCSVGCHPDLRPIALSALATAIAAFAGAWAAFWFEKDRRDKVETNERYLALSYALFVVDRQGERLGDLWENLLEKWKDKPDAWREMGPLDLGGQFPRIELKDLAFVLGYKEKGLVYQVAESQFLFESILGSLEGRNRLVGRLREELDRWARQREALDEPMSEGELEADVGLSLVVDLRALTGFLFKVVPEALDLSARTSERLRSLILSKYSELGIGD